MAMVKFVHSVRYNREYYPAHTPFEVNDSDIALLQKQGAIVLSTLPKESISEPKSVVVPVPSEEDTTDVREELLTMTIDELTRYAKEHDIDLQGKTRKAEIYNIIIESL